jgi:sensor domain CHASE-containing protein
MKVRTRSRLILVATIVVFLLALSFITQTVILESFRTIEQKDATANMQRVLAKMNNDVELVAASCRGWAEWDDTYTFVDTLDPEYIRSNLANPATFQNLGINYLLYFNSSGSLVYTKGYDTDAGTEIAVPPELVAIIRDSIIPEGFSEGISGRRGFSILNGNPVIIAGNRITTSDQAAPSHGMLVMVRQFDSKWINDLEQQTQLSVHLQTLGGPGDTNLVSRDDRQNMENGLIITGPSNRSIMLGSAIITGIENSPTMILVRVETSRPVIQQVENSIFILAGAIILLSIIFMVSVQLLLQRFILAPISSVVSDIKTIGESKNLSHRLQKTGDDEIVSLTQSINNMLEVIQKQRDSLSLARQELVGRNAELEELLEEIQQQRDDLNVARQELSHRNRDLEELNRKANVYLDIYLDAITYEIQNTIMGLRGYAEFLKDNANERERKFAEKISAMAKKSYDVIRNIETISRIYKTPPEVHCFDLGTIIKKETGSRPDTKIRVENCDKIVRANEMLGVVFDNLFSNSIKFGGPEVEITVTAQEIGDGMLEISVTDNGPGITDAMKPGVFDRFLKDSTTRSSYGLGLHIVKMLIESFGGKVWAGDRVEGDFRQGAAIRFTLKEEPDPETGC